MSKIQLIRHAQASYLAENYDKLSELGEQQSIKLGQHLAQAKQQYDLIFCGPLRRQKKTFELVEQEYQKVGLSIPKPIFLEELKEHEGTEGINLIMDKLQSEYPKVEKWLSEIENNPKMRRRNTLLIFQLFMDEWALGKVKVPMIQSWIEFRSMTRFALQEILEQTPKGVSVGVFTSGGVIASMTAEALAMKNEQKVSALNFAIRNTSISNFFYSKKQFNLLNFNELPHLPKEMITFV